MYIAASTLLTLTSTHLPSAGPQLLREGGGTQGPGQDHGAPQRRGTFGVSLCPLSITILMEWLAFKWRQLYLFWVSPIDLGLVLLYFVRDEQAINGNNGVEDAPGEEGEAETLLTREFLLYISFRGVRTFAGSMVGAFLSIYRTEVRG